MNEKERSVKLSGSLKKTATWVKISEKGDIVVEFYDYSESAQSFMGNDVAYFLEVESGETGRIKDLLSGDEGFEPASSSTGDLLLDLIQNRFRDYFEIKAWLEEKEIRFSTEFDSRA